MASDGDSDAEFDEEELAEGFDEETLDDDLGDDEVEVVDDIVDADDDVVDAVEEFAAPDDEVDAVEDDDEPSEKAAPVDDDEDLVDDADVERALDEVLAETILRTTVTDDDDEAVIDVDPTLEATETILPKQDDEFRCTSCRLLKKMSQLADPVKMLCRDCV